MPNIYILKDTGGYFYHYIVLELSLLRNLSKFPYEDKIYIHIPHLKKYNQDYMYEAIKYFEPDVELVENIDNISKYNRHIISDHEPLINDDRNMVCKEAILYLRDIFLRKIQYTIEEKNYVFITREDSELLSNNIKIKRRQILNESELYEPLKSLGFKIIKLQDLSFSEKIKIFQTAALIVGPEGSNLTLSLVANKKAKIVSICYENSYLEHTKHIANQLDIDFTFYSNVERISITEDGDKHNAKSMSDNMIINVDNFISFIRSYT
jgi:capsular polysaccharide biosynthesis protein